MKAGASGLASTALGSAAIGSGQSINRLLRPDRSSGILPSTAYRQGEGMTDVQPFTINVPQATLDDLRTRLAQTRWPDAVEGAGWDYGANLEYMQELATYWQNDFDWRAQEAMLNQFDHFRADVDGMGIHFIHEVGTGENPIPLLVMHGWPSSSWQMYKIIPMLTDPASYGGDPADSFTVIAVDLPGYGFSDRPTQPGMGIAPMAEIMHKLMTEHLGYSRYGTRSSDLGAGVMSMLAVTHADALIGNHTSGTNPYIGQNIPTDLSPAEQEFVATAQQWMQTEMAYAMLQSSKPQTLAYGLNDSPSGLAAWIVEKFWRWGDTNGNVESRFTKDELLTNLTIYWATETINSSTRLYYENARMTYSGGGEGGAAPARVPTAIIMSSKDMFPTPREWIERSGPVDRWIETDSGGHFLELEEPELIVNDLREFFRPLRQGGSA
jgi:pimeloyl-ACP methyl ester carboxylesterase